MTNFTQAIFRKFGLGLVALFFCLSSQILVQAQDAYTVKVTAPAAIAGDYPSLIAAFGPGGRPYSLSGDLVLANDSIVGGMGGGVNDGCEAIKNDLTGKIAVIDRGFCGFSIKVLNAQKRGAIAVIVVNNSAAAIIPMGGTAPSSDSVTISSFMISQANGNAIKAQLASGVKVTITQNPPPALSESAEPIVWGKQTGQGDFNGGLNGWTSNTLSCNNGAVPDTFKLWRWNPNGIVRTTCFRNLTGGYVYSPTRSNGTAVFGSEFADNNGVNCNTAVGMGPCPSPHAGELVSPNINTSASNSTDNFILRFYQSALLFDATLSIAWTRNGGATWDTTQVNEDVEAQAVTEAPSILRVELEGTAGADSLRVKFIFDGEYYYWAIDDVQIVEKALNNLRVNPFFAIPQNAATPLKHVESIAFLADIENVGAKAQPNTNLNVEILYRATPTGPITSVFSTDRSYGNVPAGALIENLPFARQFTPTAVGTYFGGYTIESDSTDAEESNNVQEFTFLVTDTLFSKELTGPNNATRPADSNWEGANEPHSWAWGNYYYVPKANNNFIRTISFAMQIQDQGAIGKELLLSVYKWVDRNEDSQVNPTERTSLGFASYTITGTEAFNRLITLPFPNREDPPVKLEDSTAYLVMVEYNTEDANDIFISYVENQLDYAAMVLVNDSINRPRYANILGANGDLSAATYSTVGFGNELVPSVRMSVGASLRTDAKDLTVLENKFTVFPNPTSDVLNLQLNLDKQASTASIRLYDLSGRMLQQWSYDNIQNERFQYNLENLSSGTYFLQVVTAEGAGTKKFTVSK